MVMSLQFNSSEITFHILNLPALRKHLIDWNRLCNINWHTFPERHKLLFLLTVTFRSTGQLQSEGELHRKAHETQNLPLFLPFSIHEARNAALGATKTDQITAF